MPHAYSPVGPPRIAIIHKENGKSPQKSETLAVVAALMSVTVPHVPYMVFRVPYSVFHFTEMLIQAPSPMQLSVILN